ncbi:MAG: O-methyltransferase [Lachnospiraceae bacterium]|nr:O-methyltransferase [Lachnospiraceae bacterium]
MTRSERTASFIESLENPYPDWLTEIENRAVEDDVPIIRKETAALLGFIVKSRRPERILEVGTATGFSALLMWNASAGKAYIDTIEKYEKRIPLAKENFRKYAQGMIELYEGDAVDILPGLAGQYDMIFMDAAKGQYLNFLPQVLRLLKCGGILITDNVLQEGDVTESRYAVCRRDRTIHGRMRDYLYELKHNDELESVILSGGDGMAVSIKKVK